MARDFPLTADPATVERAQHALHALGDGNLGIDPGRFVLALYAAYRAGDPENRTKLQVAFPEILEPYRLGMFTVDGVEELRRFVKDAQSEWLALFGRRAQDGAA
jgi:hypothetical protein